MANVEGVFYVLIAGVIVAMILAFIVVLFETRSVCKENEVCFLFMAYVVQTCLDPLQVVIRIELKLCEFERFIFQSIAFEFVRFQANFSGSCIVLPTKKVEFLNELVTIFILWHVNSCQV